MKRLSGMLLLVAIVPLYLAGGLVGAVAALFWYGLKSAWNDVGRIGK